MSAVHKANGNLFIKQQKNQNLPQGRIFFCLPEKAVGAANHIKSGLG